MITLPELGFGPPPRGAVKPQAWIGGRGPHHVSDPILAKVEKCTAAWEAVSASSQRVPLPLYCAEHDKWEVQHNEVARSWRDAWCDLLATQPTTRQGAIALIDAFLLYQGAELTGDSIQSCLRG